MVVALHPRHLGRYRDMARLLIRHGRRDLLQTSGLADALAAEDLDAADAADDGGPAKAEELAADLERMGATYVKLGQLLSTRADLLSPTYTEALSRLQDDVTPLDADEVEAVIDAELGTKVSTLFASFERAPLASASLGQVHRATMRDGREVVVKVQRPGVRDQVKGDIEALRDIAAFLDRHTEAGRRYGFGDLLDEFASSLWDELDYRREAANLERLASDLADHPLIVVPKPISDYTSSRVLTMSYVDGRKVTDIGPLGQLDLDGNALAEALFKAYLSQILDHGFFHADPHPGNVLVTADGRLALIDLGMVARLGPEIQERLVKLLLAVSEGRGEEVAQISLQMGEALDDLDEGEFTRRVAALVGRHQGSSVGDLQAGAIVVELSRIGGECGLRPPPALSMLGKALLNLDLVARTLDADFDPNDAIRRHAGEVLQARLWRSTSQGNVMAGVMEAKELIERFPGRANRILENLAQNEFRVKVDSIDEQELMRGFQKVANRVTTGLVIAALVMGAALLMRIPTEHRLFGYPALAIVLFLVAAGSGMALVISIFLTDRRGNRARSATRRRQR
ncbi:MAG TPA: AarF/ABC1/UbiB kinase family protein [Acidimicrobiales bacterium]|nr:AarF/ABC1/UbiB kinase family protein [Acidimicrobiales bacterium]